jgi:hypothetical protein
MRRNHNLFILICQVFLVKSQLPNTDVWLFKLETNKQKQTVLTEPLNITNREGYDNQPSFTEDGKQLFYVSIKEDKQADIYCYDLKSKINRPITKSKESEYSPSLTPDGKHISCVMVEKDSTQRIHFINPELGFDESKLDVDSVGYCTFLNMDTVVYYKLTTPHSLRVMNRKNNEDKWLCNNPIRTFKMIDRHTLIYGIKDSTFVTYYKYDFLLRRAYKYAEYPSTNEDICWDRSLGLLKSEGTQILKYDEEKKEWQVLYDLGSSGIKKITRFCIDATHKYLAVVNNIE